MKSQSFVMFHLQILQKSFLKNVFKLAREELEEGQSASLDDDITVMYSSCRSCQRSDNEHLLLLCDGNVGQNADGSIIRCNVAYHSYCLPEKLERIPEDDWFCPFCTSKRENAGPQLNALPLEAPSTSNPTLLGNESIIWKDLESHSNKNSEPSEMNRERTEGSESTKSGTTIADGTYSDSDVEIESIRSNFNNQSTELYSETDTGDEGDFYEGRNSDRSSESGNETTIDESEGDDAYGKLITSFFFFFFC